MKVICDWDCFRCKFADCIQNGTEPSAEKKAEIAERFREKKQREKKQREKSRSYYLKNREKVLEYQKEYQKEYREKNREALNAKRRERYQANREKEIARSTEYNKKHREAQNARARAWYYRNKEKREAVENREVET